MESLSFRERVISFILKGIIIAAVTVGVVLSYKAGAQAFMGGNKVFMYFTIQSNIAIAIVALIGAILIVLKNPVSYIWYVIKLVFTVSITLTGAVFTFVLAPTMGASAWSFSNILTHVVVPLASIADFFVICINAKYRKIDVLFVLVPPLLYVVYAGIGYACDWKFTSTVNYPYFFLNWGSKAGAFGFSSELPFIGVIWWIVLLSGMIVGVGYLYLFIINKLRNKFNKEN